MSNTLIPPKRDTSILVLKENTSLDIPYLLSLLAQLYPDLPIFSNNHLQKNKGNSATAPSPFIPFNNLNHYLGTGLHGAIIDMTSFNADYLVAISDTIIAGGKCLIILLETSSKGGPLNYFNYFISCAMAVNIPVYTSVHTNDALGFANGFLLQHRKLSPSAYNTRDITLNSEQSKFCTESWKLLTTTPKHIILLMGNRGTGKTTCAAVLVKQLLKNNQRIGFLNAGSSTLSSNYDLANNIDSRPVAITLENYQQMTNDVDILIIEEAAAFPYHKLQPVISCYRHVLLVTTCEGYEGSGRKIVYDYMQAANEHTSAFILSQCYRFNFEDKLATLLANACFIPLTTTQNSSLAPPPEKENIDCSIAIDVTTAASLLYSPERACNINRLLRQNHYEETLQDLIRWIGNDSILIIASAGKEPDSIIGVIAATLEGINDPRLAEGIYNGERRPPGNLFPQSLIAHAGLKHIAHAKWLRVERIAVSMKCRRHKIASRMIEALCTIGQNQGINFCCTAFALNLPVVKFWLQAEFRPIATSLTPDNASGLYSLYMVRPLDNKIRTRYITNYGKNIFKLHLPFAFTQKIITGEFAELISCHLKDDETTNFDWRQQLNSLKSKGNIKQIIDLYSESTNNYILSVIAKHHIHPLMNAIANHHHSVTHALPEIMLFTLSNIGNLKRTCSNNEIATLTKIYFPDEQGFNPTMRLNKQQAGIIRNIINKLLKARRI